MQRAGVMGAADRRHHDVAPSPRRHARFRGKATLALNPRACGDAGWQLSFAAVAASSRWDGRCATDCAGCAVALPSLGERISSAVGDGLVEGIAITLAATLATAPLLAHHFGSVPSTGLLANLLALPAVALPCGLGWSRPRSGRRRRQPRRWGGSRAPSARWRTCPWHTLRHWPNGPAARAAANSPLGGTLAVTGAYGALAIAAAAALRAAAALGPRAEELAVAWRRRPRSHRFGGRRGAGRNGPGRRPAAGDASTARRAHGALSGRVGQGDATLVQHPDGASPCCSTCGRPRLGVVRLLSRRAASPPVATHASRDHHAGCGAGRRYPVGVLLDGGDGTRDPGFRALIAVARRRACAAYRPSPR